MFNRCFFRNRRSIVLLALPAAFLVLILTIMAGCASGTPAGGTGASAGGTGTAEINGTDTPLAGGRTINIGYITADQLHSPALMVMKEKKLLEAAGFNVEWHEYIAGAYAIQDMASDTIDFACCGVVPIIINHSQGLDLAVIAGSNQEGSSLVVADYIRTVGDLDGKTIATPGLGSLQDAMLTRLALENHIGIDRTTMDVSDMPDFLKSGEIDGFIAWAPHPDNAVNQKLGRQLVTSSDIMPNHQCCVLVTKSGTLKDDPETVQKLLEVYLDAYRWFLDNRDESMGMIAKATGVDETVVRSAAAAVKYSYPPYCNTDSMASAARGLIDAGRITAMDEADIEGFIMEIYQPGLMDAIA